MGRITGGEISYSETRKIAEYENKTAKCSLSFGFDDGEDYDTILSGIQAQAKHRVQVMLGIVKAPVEVAKPIEDKAEAVEPPKPKKRGPKPRVEEAVAEEPVDDPAETEVEEVEEEVETDPLADLEGEEEAVEITDADLTKAIAQRKEKLGEDGGVKIRKLILKYAPKIPAIPQNKRSTFLETLKALK